MNEINQPTMEPKIGGLQTLWLVIIRLEREKKQANLFEKSKRSLSSPTSLDLGTIISVFL